MGTVFDPGLTMVRRAFRVSIRFKLAVFIALAMTVGAGAFTLAGYAVVRDLLVDQVRERLVAAVSTHQAMLQAYLRMQLDRITGTAGRERLIQLLQKRESGTLPGAEFRAESGRLLTEIRAGTDGFREVSITDPAGRIIGSSDDTRLDRSESEEEEFLLGLSESVVGVPRRSGQGYDSRLAAPMRNAAGRLLGVVMVRLDATPLVTFLSVRSGLGYTGEVLLGTRQGDRISYLPTPRQGRAPAQRAFDEDPLMADALRGHQKFLQADDGGAGVLAAYRPLGYRDWGLLARIDADEALEPVARLRGLLAGLVLVVLAGGAAGAYVLARRFTQPILRMTETATAIASGDLAARVAFRSGDEIGVLGSAFNRMTERLIASYGTLERRVQERTAELARSDLRHRLIVDTANDAFVAIDAGGVIIDWNPQAEKTFGWPRAEALGKSLAETVIPPSLREAHQTGLKRFLLTGEGPVLGRRIEITARHRDGRDFPVELTISPLRWGDSFIFNAFLRDISQRKKAEADLERQSLELARSNAELEQFAYVASHDLQEPIRKIVVFGSRLRDRVLPTLGEEGRDDLDRMLNAARRMKSLIEDLLQLSRATTSRQTLEPVPLERVIRDVLSDLELTVQDSGTTVEVGSLPVVRGDAVQMRQLFQNLVVNALKFRRPGTPHRVRIEGHVNGSDFCRVRVEDNGIGFESRFAEDLFKPFYRLHTREEYEGSGMGLAICRKIAERHGGAIQAQGDPGKGSVFEVSLPMAETPGGGDAR